ncbi:unnamed protein product, partial [Candidula unifasciata]
DKKQAKGRERDDKIKEQEVLSRRGPRHQEMAKIKALLKQRRLKLYEIPADGNCLYTSVSHQLSVHSFQMSTEELRQKTAEYLRSHRDDFLPFLTNPDSGDILTAEEFEKYCDKTANSPVWGGQVELRALSEILQVPIEVLQADTSPQIIGENMQGKPLILVYHRHVYFLGEHYNSVVPDDQNEETNDVKAEDSSKKNEDSDNNKL